MKKLLAFALLLCATALFVPIDTGAVSFTIAIAPQAVTADYFDNIVTSFDLNQTKFLPELIRRYGNQGTDVLDMLMALGYERTTDVETVRHFEENWIHQAFKNKSAQNAGAAGAAVNITLASDSVDASNRFYPRVTDIVTFPNEVTGMILSIDVSTPSAPVLSVAPNDVNDAIPTLTAGEVLIITGNAFSEGSTQPKGRFSGAWQYNNVMQIVKESLGASGTQMTNATWTKLMDGKNIEGWFNKGLLDIDYRMKTNIQGTFLTQKRTTNPLIVDTLNNNGTVKTTEGFYPYLKRVGIPYPYQPGTWSIADFNTIERLQVRQFAPRTVCDMAGLDIDIEIEDTLKEYFQFTNIDYTIKTTNNKFFGEGPGGDALAATVAFNYFTKAGRVHCMKRFEALSNPQTFGADGYAYPGRATVIPLEKKKDPKSKNDIPSIGVVYKAMGTNNRKMEVWDYGAAGGGPKLGTQDRRDWYMRTEVSSEFMSGNQMVDIFVQ